MNAGTLIGVPTDIPSYDPQLALLARVPPEGDGWLHELKLDGFRIGGAWSGGGRPAVAAGEGLDGRVPGGGRGRRATGGRSRAARRRGRGGHARRTDLAARDGGRRPDRLLRVRSPVRRRRRSAPGSPIETRKTRLRALLGAHPPGPAPVRRSCGRWGSGVLRGGRPAPHRRDHLQGRRLAIPGRGAQRELAKDQVRAPPGVRARGLRALDGRGAWARSGSGTTTPMGSFCSRARSGRASSARPASLLAAFAKLERATPAFTGGLPTGRKHSAVRWLEPELVGEAAFMEWTGARAHPSRVVPRAAARQAPH